MRRLAFVVALAFLCACPKGNEVVQLKDKWQEVTGAAEGASEAAALESWVTAARSAKAVYTVSIIDAAGNTVPVSQWDQKPEQTLTVILRIEMRDEKRDETLRWVPRERGNIAILLRE